jgi:transmembrane sensor
MENEQFWLLVSLKLSGEATAAELQELQLLLQEQPELGLQQEAFEKIWQQRHAGFYTDTNDAYNKHLQRLSNYLSAPVLTYENSDSNPGSAEITKPTEKGRGKRIFIVIGSIAASLLVFFLFFYNTNAKRITGDAGNTVSTKAGSKSKIQLPDGTQVWLNADSKLTYNENFLGDFREVQLTGEAYFDVAKDKNHPFIIHTPTIDLKVLGTAFNVRSYSNEKNTETSLIHGSVEITLKNSPDKKIILKPNEKLIIQNVLSPQANLPQAVKQSKTDPPLLVLDKIHFREADSSATEILWVKNKLAFDGETLENIALKIERWYDVKVQLTDERLKDVKYSAVFADESLQEVMEALRLTGSFRYTIAKKEVVINYDAK